jgi:tetratricopeptide (TPR) repeat protein
MKALNGAAWRFGANAATKLVLSAPAKIGGKDLAAGSYALFAFPGDGSWTLALNTVADQWGSYFHDPKKDVLRFDVKPGVGPHQERLLFVVDVKDDNTLTVRFAWGTITLAFDVGFDVNALEEAQIADFLRDLDAKDVATRLAIAQLRVKRGRKIDEALRLVEEAEQIAPSFWGAEWKGRALHALGRTEEAIPLLEKAAALARGKAPDGYCDNLLEEVAAWRKK